MAVTVAIFEASGHCTGDTELNPTCASVHASRPLAADGLIVMPSGSVTLRVAQMRRGEPLGIVEPLLREAEVHPEPRRRVGQRQSRAGR